MQNNKYDYMRLPYFPVKIVENEVRIFEVQVTNLFHEFHNGKLTLSRQGDTNRLCTNVINVCYCVLVCRILKSS